MCMLHTAMGKTLTLKHNVCTPCPYDRGNLYLCTMGIFRGINFPEKPEDVYEMGSPCQFGWIGKTNAKVIEFPDYTRGGWKAASRSRWTRSTSGSLTSAAASSARRTRKRPDARGRQWHGVI